MGELKWHEIDDKALAALDRIAAAWHAREGSPCSREAAVERLIEVGAVMAESGARLFSPAQLRSAAMTNAAAAFVLAMLRVTDIQPNVTPHFSDDAGAYLAVRDGESDEVLEVFPAADGEAVHKLLQSWGAACAPLVEVPDSEAD